MRVDLPDGQWADLYDPVKVPERKRRPVVRALLDLLKARAVHGVPSFDAEALTDEDKAAAVASQLDPSLLSSADELTDAVAVALVQAWSFEKNITVDSLLDLPADAYKALSEACVPMLPSLLPQFEVSPDPKATTGS